MSRDSVLLRLRRCAQPRAEKAMIQRTGPSVEIKRLGGKARAEQLAREAGIPADAPKNKHGQSCAEKTCVICGAPFLAQWSKRIARKTCSPACARELKRARGGKARTGRANPNFKHGSRAGVRDRAGERRWFEALAVADRCAIRDCVTPTLRLAAHHVIYRQEVARVGGDVWDPRNGLVVCSSCHASHHGRGRVIPLSMLPDSAFEFAAEVMGPERAYEYLRRRYEGSDMRHESLLLGRAA